MRLSQATLDRLPADVVRPAYDRASVRPGVVHLGIGAFHRAHQATIFEAALASGDLRWGIIGVSLRSPQVRDQLVPQDGLYTVVERDGGDEHLQVIGAIVDVLVAPEDPSAVVAAIASPETHLVTLTVTEKGYKLDRATGSLQAGDPDIVQDLASLDRPRTVPGLLVAGLAARRAAGLLSVRATNADVTIARPPAELRVAALGDFRRVLQVLVNLIGNAVRYSPRGAQVIVTVTRTERHAVVVVADKGKGVAPEDQVRIFEKFERVDPSEAGGNGLGLYIARRLARAMQGDLTIESAPGQGARFILTLPADPARH